eukprot:2653454-Rhodomonas_salina.1
MTTSEAGIPATRQSGTRCTIAGRRVRRVRAVLLVVRGNSSAHQHGLPSHAARTASLTESSSTLTSLAPLPCPAHLPRNHHTRRPSARST